MDNDEKVSQVLYNVVEVSSAVTDWRSKDDFAGRHSRPELLFLHYFGGSSCEWTWVAEALAAKGYSCLGLDARGHGESVVTASVGKLTPKDFSVEAMAQDVVTVSDRNDIADCSAGWVLVGHSMGGKTALIAAAAQPKGLRGLILVNPSPPTPQPMSDQERQKDINRYGDAEAAEQTAFKIAAPGQISPGGLWVFVNDNLRTTKEAWLAWNEHGSREDISAVMSSITLPTLLITGSEDPVISQEVYQREVVQRLPNLTDQLVIPGGGHLITMTHAEIVAEKIKIWIASL